MNLHWLLRYARRWQLKLKPGELPANAIKSRFTPPAWRLVCRSGRDRFIPILRNRHLTFDSLVHYAQTLVEHGFQVAPNPEFLDHFIRASYRFFDRLPRVPDSQEEMTLLRLATRHGAVPRKELQRVHDWLGTHGGTLTTRMTWRAVLRRANEWHQRQQLVINHARANHNSSEPQKGWDFASGTVAWHGYEIIPLTNEIDLWDEGQAMSSCLYKLRYLCSKGSEPSRFFSVRKHGRRYATLELVREKPYESRLGLGLMDGSWQLQDCRLSYNRLPSDELIETLSEFAVRLPMGKHLT